MSSNKASKLENIVLRAINEANNKGVKPTKTAVNKFLYITKQNLPEENKYSQDILTFWYKHGGVVDNAHFALNNLEEGNFIQKENGRYYTANEEAISKNDEDDEKEFIETLNQSIDEYNVYDDEKLDKLYDNYAPYRFMVTFKNEVISEADKLSTHNSRKRFFQWSDNLEDEIEELRSQLLKAESELPLDNEFREYSDIFSRFVGISNYFFDTNPERDQFHLYSQLCESIWNLFACKIRLLEKDEGIDIQEKNWESKYKEQKRKTLHNLEFFEDVVRQVDKDQDPRSSDVWEKIVKTNR